MKHSDIEKLEGRWGSELEELSGKIAPLFRRSDASNIAFNYLRGLLSNTPRKNGWQLSEVLGKETPYAIQHLLDRCKWSADTLRDEVQHYVLQNISASDGILILDETGFIKKGTHSAGVQRQYSGTAGRVENCQIGVFLAYASRKGRTFIDRELYIPKSWLEDKERCNKAKIPDGLTFATKPEMGIKMLKRALDSSLSIAWVTGDCVYGGDFKLRNFLAGRSQPYVLMVQNNHQIFIGFESLKLEDLSVNSILSWQRLSCGNGSKGKRIYDWALFPLQYDAPENMRHFVLFRRNKTDENKLACYLVLAPITSSLQEIINVAGSRWAVEECFQTAKGEVGLDEYEVRSWHGWYRHITLAILAHAFLTTQQAKAVGEKKEQASPNSNDPFDHTRNPQNNLADYALGSSTIKKSDLPLVALAKKASTDCENMPL